MTQGYSSMSKTTITIPARSCHLNIMFSVDDLDLDLNEDVCESNKNIQDGSSPQSIVTSSTLLPPSAQPPSTVRSPLKRLFNCLRDSTQNFNHESSPKIQRKFPGPAGLLPDKPPRSFNDSSLALGRAEEIPSDVNRCEPVLCSQASQTAFMDPPFQKLKLEFELKSDSPLTTFTVDWIRKKAVNKSLKERKIPFLAVILQNVDCSFADPLITLRDSTGELLAALHRAVWQDLGQKLKSGAAMALKQVSVLSTGTSRRQVILNITMNNILKIFTPNDDDSVEVTNVHSSSLAELTQSVATWRAKSHGRDSPSRSPDLFRSVSSSPNLFQTVTSMKGFASSPVATKLDSSRSRQNPTIENNRKLNGTCVTKNSKSIACDEFVSDFDLFMDEDFPDPESFNQCKVQADTPGHTFNKPAVIHTQISKSLTQSFNKTNIACAPLSSSQRPLSQAESIIVNEILSGVELDDFTAEL